MKSIDLNCDMGESFGSRIVGDDAAIMPFISSANIACGYHGGDPVVIHNTIKMALQFGVKIGAHPSFPDLDNFGRKEMQVSEDELFDLIVYQVSALLGFAKINSATLNHVKPHGALYNMAARDGSYAMTIAKAVKTIDPNLILVGLAGSKSIEAAKSIGLKTCSEVFADRTYQEDGSLTPRTHPNSLINDPALAVVQVVKMVEQGEVKTINGNTIKVKAESVCIHGDTPGAADYSKAIRRGLEKKGIIIRSFNPGE
jgi:UPF0271 protein